MHHGGVGDFPGALRKGSWWELNAILVSIFHISLIVTVREALLMTDWPLTDLFFFSSRVRLPFIYFFWWVLFRWPSFLGTQEMKIKINWVRICVQKNLNSMAVHCSYPIYWGEQKMGIAGERTHTRRDPFLLFLQRSFRQCWAQGASVAMAAYPVHVLWMSVKPRLVKEGQQRSLRSSLPASSYADDIWLPV